MTARVLHGAIVGYGEVAANGHCPAYRRSAEAAIVAVVDRSADRRAAAAAQMPGVETFAELGDIPAALALDFVDVCTPPALHPQPMLDAIARGCHVLCEKPFLLDPAVIDVVRRRAAGAGVAVLPVHNWKYAPIVQHATGWLRAGLVGTLRRVAIETTRVRAAPTAEADAPNWRRDPEIAGGGILMDHGWHSIYLALHWFARPATGVRASLRRPAGGGVEDEAQVTVAFGAGEAAIALSWNGARRYNTVRLEGTAGAIVVADDVLHWTDVAGGLRESVTFPSGLSAGSHHDDWFAAMLPDVVAAFRDPSRAVPLFDEAAACLAIVQQAYRSDAALSGRP